MAAYANHKMTAVIKAKKKKVILKRCVAHRNVFKMQYKQP